MEKDNMSIKKYNELFAEYLARGDARWTDEALGKSVAEVLDSIEVYPSLNRERRPRKIIVSLTSIPERIKYVTYAIRSMMIQSVKADKIILWLDKDRFNDEILSKELRKLTMAGVDVKYVEDVGAHTKYLYAIQYYSEDFVVTIDDDIMYPTVLIENLWNTHLLYPHAVCAHWVLKMRMTQDGVPYPINNFEDMDVRAKSDLKTEYMAQGVGGILYPPHCIKQEYLDTKLIRKLASKQDDIWLKAVETLSGTDVVRVQSSAGIVYPYVPGSQKVALRFSNAAGGNDRYIKNVFEFWNLYRFFGGIEKKENNKIKTLMKWVEVLQKGYSISEYLKRKGYQTVVIYGMGQLGGLLFKELSETDIKVLYAIDRNKDVKSPIPIVDADAGEFMEADCLIVTAGVYLSEFKNIKEAFSGMLISLEDLLVEMQYYQENELFERKI